MKKITLIIAFAIGIGAQAQQTNTHESDIMYKKEITRAIDLREKQNEPLFSRGREITRILIDAVKAGILTPYTSDSLSEKISLADFNKSLEIPSTSPQVDTAYIEDEWEKQQAIERLKNFKADMYSAKDLYQLEITEDLIFDKQHSVMEQNIKTITFFIPASHPDNIKGIQQPIATFDYNECRKLFQDNPMAIWYNPYNDQEHKSLADAFDLRLFSSYILKVSNPQDDYISDIYGYGKSGIIASKNTEIQIQEYESNLWEN